MRMVYDTRYAIGSVIGLLEGIIMNGIIDLSQVRKDMKEKKKKAEGEANRKVVRLRELIQVSATTIGMFINAVQWAMSYKFDEKHFAFLTESCNYQLTAFARAYGYPVQQGQIPVVLHMTAALDPESKQVIYDIDVEGSLAEDVQVILAAHNPGMQQIPPDGP